jgi:TRAP transporter 4TM/12TM fusion protein
MLESRSQRAVHFLFMLPLAFMLYPARARSPRDRPSALDVLLACASVAVNGYLIVNVSRLDLRWEGVTWPLSTDVIMGTAAVLLCLEAARRAAAAALAVVTAGFLVWMLASSHVFASSATLGQRFARMIEILYLFQGEGMYGNLLGVAATYVSLFVLFGAFTEKTGAASLFTDFARLVVGRARGSAAKIAVVSSALFGTVSGQGTAGVYTTGTFTIPLMKKSGYSPELAAGIEATASMGGALLPPVMGTAAFVMADFLGMPLTTLMKRALVPALFYYLGILLVVHLDACRTGYVSPASEEMPRWRAVALNSYRVAPLFVLVAGLILGYSALLSGLAAIGSAVIICALETRDRKRFAGVVWDSLVQGTRNTVMVSVSCACGGIIVAAVAYTGLAVMFGTALIAMVEQLLPLILLLTMVVTLILGIGLPATPSYILTVALLAPSLSILGVETVLIHLFVFYFAILADVSPPVCLATYAAAGLAGADPMKAGMEGLKVSFAGFLVPFMFIYHPALTLKGSWESILLDVALGILIVFIAAVALTGWLRVPLNLWERGLLLSGTIVLVHPSTTAIAIAAALIGASVVLVAVRLALARRRRAFADRKLAEET